MILKYIFDKLGIDLNNITANTAGTVGVEGSNTDPILIFCLGILILSSAVLICFFNISIYFFSILMLKEYEEKLNNYPKIKKLMNRISKLRLTYLIIDFIGGIICCLSIIISCLLALGIISF